jgi:hypothetical protein
MSSKAISCMAERKDTLDGATNALLATLAVLDDQGLHVRVDLTRALCEHE